MAKARKPKFRVGQVACLPGGIRRAENTYGKVLKIDATVLFTTAGNWLKEQCRPLTRTENKGDKK
jgi:hypothetical protein